MVEAKLKIRLDTRLKKSASQITGQVLEMVLVFSLFYTNVKPRLWLLSPLFEWFGGGQLHTPVCVR